MAASLTSCCAILAACSNLQVAYPSSSAYNATEKAYWSLQESSLIPSCIVTPRSTRDVAEIVSKLVSNSTCSFAIKAQGHAPAAGFANIDGGVTIDLTSLDAISTNEDHSVARVGAGASWVDVYAALDPLGRSAAGGRNGLVGVGGLTLGGGISYFSPQVGFTCDTVVNFEIVSASGKILNANATSHADLYRALKGGTNNFGVVTRFDFATVPIGEILAGSIANDISQRQAVFQALANIANASTYDPHASVVVGMIFNVTTKAWSLGSTPIYTQPVLNPPFYEELFAVPNISSSLSLKNLSTFSNESATPQLNWFFYTGTYGVSADFLEHIFDICNTTASSADIPGLILLDLAFEPLPTVFLSHGAGKNAMGTSPNDGNGIVLLLSGLWASSTTNEAVHALATQIMTSIETAAHRRDLLHKFVYANYADATQKPIASYGAENVRFLRRVARKYDPAGVFQKRVPGGFKLDD